MTTAPATEETFAFGCEGQTLVGVLHRPAADGAETGVVVVVGGPQYRAGSHRQFVHLARSLATGGHTVLRFDVRGMGDGTGEARSFEHITPDIGAAIDALQTHAPGIRRVVLWGLCDGASASLLYLNDRNDDRVAGLCMLNPWVRSEASLARTHVRHYYLQRLGQREFWAKLVRGKVAGDALSGLAASLKQTLLPAADQPGSGPARAFQARMATGLGRFTGPVQIILSGQDYTAREFCEFAAADPSWTRLLKRPGLDRHDLAQADHTFSDHRDAIAMTELFSRWLADHFGTAFRARPARVQ